VTGSVHLCSLLLINWPLVPHLAHVLPLYKIPTPRGFPNPNIHLIRTTLWTRPKCSLTIWLTKPRLGHETLDIDNFYISSFNCWQDLKVLIRPTLKKLTNLPFLRKTAGAETSRFISYICRLPKLSDKWESGFFYLFLVSFWLNVLLFSVCYGERWSSRYTVFWRQPQ
jgi:hypothetical protein